MRKSKVPAGFPLESGLRIIALTKGDTDRSARESGLNSFMDSGLFIVVDEIPDFRPPKEINRIKYA